MSMLPLSGGRRATTELHLELLSVSTIRDASPDNSASKYRRGACSGEVSLETILFEHRCPFHCKRVDADSGKNRCLPGQPVKGSPVDTSQRIAAGALTAGHGQQAQWQGYVPFEGLSERAK